MRRARDEVGQSTVELALLLPVLVLLLVALVEAAMIGLDQLRLWHSAREAARIAVVDPDPDAIKEAAERNGLTNLRVGVEPATAVRTAGEPLTVTLAYRPDGHFPLFGEALFGGVTLKADATMRIESP